MLLGNSVFPGVPVAYVKNLVAKLGSPFLHSFTFSEVNFGFSVVKSFVLMYIGKILDLPDMVVQGQTCSIPRARGHFLQSVLR